jgi:ATP-dependent RNA/DNA helicase IGHMBP2
MQYFKDQLSLLQLERDEDLNAYLKQTQSASVAERRAAGLAWYPIAIRGSEMTRGDYLSVEIERTTHLDMAHQMRFGMPVVIFSNHDPKTDRLEGIITYQGGNRLKITLRTDELPDWSRDGKLGVDLLFDNHSYDQMQDAIKMAATAMDKQENDQIIKVLLGKTAPGFNTQIHPYQNERLNELQLHAVRKILAAKDLAIVHGPPGTGKTTTLVQAIKALQQQDKQQILVVAPSNTAVDLLTEKLAAEGLNVLRIGNPARVSEQSMALTLDGKLAGHAEMKQVKALKKQASEYKNMAHKYKRNFGKAEKEQRKALFDEAHKIMREVGKIEEYLTEDLLTKANVITATLVGANHHTLKGRRFYAVVIDESGQALEPASWIPILKAEKVIFAGDHFQLSPTIKSNEAARGGFNTTLLEKCVSLHPESVVLLEEQYRMNENIMGYSSRVFYGDRLMAHSSVRQHLLFPEDLALEFIDTAGCSFEEKMEGTSATNPDEAVFLLKHLSSLVEQLSQRYTPEHFPSIGIISPYKQQLTTLRELILDYPMLGPYLSRISINTIDSFQGQERDIVYLSMTRSNPEGAIGFLSDTRRMNVAMTRARKKLVIIGDSATLSRLPFYADLIGYAEEKSAYKSAWEFIE